MPLNTDAYIRANRERFLAELFTLLRQPSISTRNEGMNECAALLAGRCATSASRPRSSRRRATRWFMANCSSRARRPC